MAALFELDSPVLHFGPRLPAGVRYSQRRFLLWPALLYRVVAPEVRPRQVNILQKAVLGMCRAGITFPPRIGEKLRIHADLATLILSELLQMRLIRPDGLPTPAGNEVFEAEALDMRASVTGHVFQDPWSGDLWPRFVQRLDYVELDRRENGFPDLILGTKGKPRRERALMCRPLDFSVPPALEVRQILRATHRHKAALRNSDTFEVADEDEHLNLDAGSVLERISLVDDSPTPVFLSTFIYLAENEHTGDWHACDPFGLGESPTLRRAIERQLAFFPRLRDTVEALVGSSLDAQVEKQRGWIAVLRAHATSNLERKLTVNARDLPEFEQLVQLEMASVDADFLGDDCPEQRLRDLLGATRRVLESAFRSIAARFPPGDVWRHVYFKDKNGKDCPVQDQVYVSGVYEARAATLGFKTPLPTALARTRPSHVKAACFESGWRLRGAIIAAVMAATDQPNHPLVQAAKRRPELIEDLDRVAVIAGGAIHAGDGSLELAAISPVIESVYGSIAILGGIEVGATRLVRG
jgi:hypothetical protein